MITIEYKDLDMAMLRDTLLEEGLVVIKNAFLDVSEFEALGGNFGKKLVTDKHVINENRDIQELSNDGLFGDREVYWHHDWSYGRGDFYGSILYNVQGAELSPTYFCDMSKVTPELLYQYVDVVGKYYPPTDLHEMCFTERQLKLLEKQQISRPFTFNHYITDEPILYCSIGTLQEMTPSSTDTNPILRYVEDNKYTHMWEAGDVLLWDNLKMIHMRDAFTGDRLLWRTQFVI